MHGPSCLTSSSSSLCFMLWWFSLPLFNIHSTTVESVDNETKEIITGLNMGNEVNLLLIENGIIYSQTKKNQTTNRKYVRYCSINLVYKVKNILKTILIKLYFRIRLLKMKSLIYPPISEGKRMQTHKGLMSLRTRHPKGISGFHNGSTVWQAFPPCPLPYKGNTYLKWTKKEGNIYK